MTLSGAGGPVRREQAGNLARSSLVGLARWEWEQLAGVLWEMGRLFFLSF